jgi:hypothetical protein
MGVPVVIAFSLKRARAAVRMVRMRSSSLAGSVPVFQR